MPLTVNRWPVIANWADPRLRTIIIPGTKRSIRVRRVTAPVFAAFFADWHREMPDRLKLDRGYIAGYNYRVARSGAGWSAHSGGVAVDARWDVLLADGRRHMTDAERAVLKRLLHRYRLADGRHVFGNGYEWRTVDEMHTEAIQGWADGSGGVYATPADFKAIRKKLGIKRNGIRTLTASGKPRRRR